MDFAEAATASPGLRLESHQNQRSIVANGKIVSHVWEVNVFGSEGVCQRKPNMTTLETLGSPATPEKREKRESEFKGNINSST